MYWPVLRPPKLSRVGHFKKKLIDPTYQLTCTSTAKSRRSQHSDTSAVFEYCCFRGTFILNAFKNLAWGVLPFVDVHGRHISRFATASLNCFIFIVLLRLFYLHKINEFNREILKKKMKTNSMPTTMDFSVNFMIRI